MDVREDLIEKTAEIQDFLISKYLNHESGNKPTSAQDQRLINEALSAITSILDNCEYAPHNKVILQKTFRLGLEVVYEKLFYYSAYYYSYEKIKNGDINDQQSSFFQINVNTATAISVFEGYRNGITDIGGSTDDYYLERMPRVLWSLKLILKENRQELFLPSLYVLYNLSQSLSLYLLSGHNFYKDQVGNLLREVLSWQIKFHSNITVEQILMQNTQLRLFKAYQFYLSEKATNKNFSKIEIPNHFFDDYKTENILRILSSIFFFDKDAFLRVFESKYKAIRDEISNEKCGLKTFLFTKCLAQYISVRGFKDELDFSLKSMQKNTVEFSNHINSIFRNYTSSAYLKLSPDELEQVLLLKDDLLREKVANTIIGVDPHILARESKKPHGVSEISDMEIPIKLNGNRYYLCMPFKSGIEISGKSVPETISYQIFRPFLHFDNCIVVFISAKRCSQNLMNYIKRMRSKLGWNIEVIENEELAKLLKSNDQLD